MSDVVDFSIDMNDVLHNNLDRNLSDGLVVDNGGTSTTEKNTKLYSVVREFGHVDYARHLGSMDYLVLTTVMLVTVGLGVSKALRSYAHLDDNPSGSGYAQKTYRSRPRDMRIIAGTRDCEEGHGARGEVMDGRGKEVGVGGEEGGEKGGGSREEERGEGVEGDIRVKEGRKPTEGNILQGEELGRIFLGEEQQNLSQDQQLQDGERTSTERIRNGDRKKRTDNGGGEGPMRTSSGNKSVFEVFKASISMSNDFVNIVTLYCVCGEVYAHDFHVMFVLVGMALGLGFALALVLPVFSAARVSCLQDYLVLRFGSRLPSVLLLLSNLVRYVVGVGLSLHLVSLCVAALTRLPPRLTAPTIAILALLFASVGGLEFSGSGSGSRLQKVLLLTSTALALVIATVDLGGLAKVLQHADLGNKLLIQGLDTETRSRHGTWAAGVLGLALGVKLYGFHQANLRRAVSLSSFAAVGSAMFLSLLPIAFVFLLAAYGGVLAAQLYPAHETTGSIHVSVCVRNLGMASRDALKIRNNFRYMRLTLDQVLPTLVMEQLEFIPGFAGFFLAIVISTAITDMASRYNLLAAILWEQSFSSLFPKIILSPALPTSRRPTPPRAPSMPPTASSLGHSVSTNPEILSLTLEKGDNNAALRPLSSSAAPPPPPPLPPELLREENKKRKCFLFIYKLVICGVSGIVSVGVSVGASHAGVGVWQLWQTTTGVMAGPVVGLFLGALFLPCLSSTSVVFGCTVGWVINSWLFLGSWLSGTTGGLQPLSPHPIPKATLQHIMDKHNLTFESIARLNPSFDCNNMATELLYCPINFLYTTREGVMSTIQHITDVEDTGDRPFEDSTRVYQSYSPERNIYQSDHVPITDKTFNKRLSEEISGTSNSNELYEQGAIEASTEQKSNLRGTQELVDIKSKHNIYPSYKEWLNVSRDSDSRDFFNGLNTSRNEIIPSVSDPRGKSQVSNKTATNGLSLVEQKSLRESNSKELNVFLKNEPERQMDFKDTTLQSRTHLIDLFQQIHLSQSIQEVTTVNKTSNINTSIEGSFENATQIVDEELHVDEINLTTQSLDQNKLSVWYNTSYCYYNSIGTIVSFMAAVVFSILTGSCHPLPPNKDVVSPISYKLFIRLRCPEFSTLFPSCSSQRTIYPIQPSAPADMLHTSKHSERYTTRAFSIIQETSGL